MEYVRVSTVLAQLPSDFVNVKPEILEAKQIVGTNVHKAIDEDIKKGLPALENSRELAYFNSFLGWKNTRDKPLAFGSGGVRYYDDAKMLTGEIDALIVLEDKEKRMLVDFKTSSQESAYKWELQAHLYHYLLTQNNICNLHDEFLFLMLRVKKLEDNTYKAMPAKECVYKYSQDSMDFAKSLVDMYWENNKKVAVNGE